jgi:hypothetical protein
MKADWKKYEQEKPEKSGIYLVILPVDKDLGSPTICMYFKKGELLLVKRTRCQGSAEERLFDQCTNPALEVRAEDDGFYMIDDEDHWEIKPVYYAEYPDAPDGMEYCDTGV